MKQSKIAIIGAGVVGSTTAYTLMLRNIASDLILVDIQDIKCKGEVEDLSDTLSFSTTSSVTMGTLQQAGQTDIVIITAGIAQKPGQSRVDLLRTNYKVVTDIIAGMKPLNPDLIIIMVTNPIDVLTYGAQQVSGLPKNQIFGSGTMLDTQRLRHIISEAINVTEQSIHVYVLGEHGDSQFVAWSSATIAGTPILTFPNLTRSTLEAMAEQAKRKAYDIIECKGSTAFGIASCVAAYCQNIISNANRVTPVSCYIKEFDVCLSMPAVLGDKGVEQIVMPPLQDQERKQLELSAATIKKYIQELQ
ncbi:MAG: L-lactate dehydrogenase [Candidatus Babeliales bacterium]